jgi:hypothetical protein
MKKIVLAALAVLGVALGSLGIAAPANAAVPWQQQHSGDGPGG